MKIIKFLVVILFFAVFTFTLREKAFAAFEPYRKLCVGIQGKFIADSNWKGGAIQIGCSGDNGRQLPVSRRPAESCTGEVQTNVRPGDTFRLTRCSCFGTDRGCLKAGKKLTLLAPDSNGDRYIQIDTDLKDTPQFVSGQCRHNDFRPICAANGVHIPGNIVISCKAPLSSPTPSTKNTPTPLPSGFICPVPGKVTNIKVTCPNCTNPTNAVNTSALNAFGSPTPVPTGNVVSSPTPIVTQAAPTSTLTPTPGQ